MKVIENGVCAAIGFKAGSIHCGIRKNQTKDDLALIVSDTILYRIQFVKRRPYTQRIK